MMKFNRVNGVSKSANKETQRLSNRLADATRVMVKKNWKPSILKLYLQGDKSAVRFYYTDKNGQVYNGQVIRNTGLSKGKYMTGSLRQVEALQELVNHLQQNGQERYHPPLILSLPKVDIVLRRSLIMAKIQVIYLLINNSMNNKTSYYEVEKGPCIARAFCVRLCNRQNLLFGFL